jgi:hypothetical protein
MIDDPMPNDRLKCAPLFGMVIRRAIIGRHSRQAVFFKLLLFYSHNRSIQRLNNIICHD